MPKVSVVMPVYNTKEEYLREAIESILNQTFSDFEFIIINDGSTNNVEKVILSYKDERIKYIKQEHKGIPYTRNRLFDLAIGEYIAFADSDDVYVLNRFEKQVAYLDNTPNCGLVSANMQYCDKLESSIVYPEDVHFLDLLKCNSVANPCVMLRKSIFAKYNLRFDEGYDTAEDYELWSRAVRYMDIHNLQEILCKYRWHGENISIKKYTNMSGNDLLVKKTMLKFLTDNENLKEIIVNLLCQLEQKNKVTLLQQIFSIKNEGKQKVLRILGIKIKFKKKNIIKDIPYKNIEKYIDTVLRDKVNIKKLVIIPSDPILAYEQKGQTPMLEEYYNPNKFFDEVFLLSPLEMGISKKYGMHIIQTSSSIYKKIIKKIQPNVIRSYGGAWAAEFALSNKVKGIPNVVSIHDKRQSYLCENIDKSDYLMSVSKACSNLLLKNHIPQNKIYDFSDRVDTNIFYKKERYPIFNHYDKNSKNILCVGRLDPIKNIKTLVNAMTYLPDNYYLTIIGRGGKDEKNLVERLCITERIQFIDKIENNELANYYNSCDCFCLPSLSEGFGIVYVEAAFCKTKIIASNISPMNDYLKHKKSAYLLDDYTNPLKLSEAIEYVCTSPDCINYGENAYANVQNFSKKIVDKKEEEIYKNIIFKSNSNIIQNGGENEI